MSVEYLHCCHKYVNLDYNCEEVIDFGEPMCYEHLFEKLVDRYDLTVQQADYLIDCLIDDSQFGNKELMAKVSEWKHS